MAYRGLRRLPDSPQRAGVERFGLEPHHVEGFQRPRELDGASQSEGKRHVERDAHVGPERVPEGLHDRHGDPKSPWADVPRPRSPLQRHGAGHVLQRHGVGLDGGEAAVEDLLGQSPQVVRRLDLRHAEQFCVACTRAATVGPVEPKLVPHLAAEQLPHRRAEGFAANVPQGGVDAGHGLVGDPARLALGPPREIPPDVFGLHRITANDHLAQELDHLRDDGRGIPVAAIPPADDALVGLDLDERPWPERSIHQERRDAGDLHPARFPRVVDRRSTTGPMRIIGEYRVSRRVTQRPVRRRRIARAGVAPGSRKEAE